MHRPLKLVLLGSKVFGLSGICSFSLKQVEEGQGWILNVRTLLGFLGDRSVPSTGAPRERLGIWGRPMIHCMSTRGAPFLGA